MIVEQFHVKNQFELRDDLGNTYFQSYDSIIAKRDINGNITLGNDWDYSKTTGRYRNLFLGEDKKETEKKIASGEYKISKGRILSNDKRKG
jgi:hypothetical protein